MVYKTQGTLQINSKCLILYQGYFFSSKIIALFLSNYFLKAMLELKLPISLSSATCPVSFDIQLLSNYTFYFALYFIHSCLMQHKFSGLIRKTFFSALWLNSSISDMYIFVVCVYRTYKYCIVWGKIMFCSLFYFIFSGNPRQCQLNSNRDAANC